MPHVSKSSETAGISTKFLEVTKHNKVKIGVTMTDYRLDDLLAISGLLERYSNVSNYLYMK